MHQNAPIWRYGMYFTRTCIKIRQGNADPLPMMGLIQMRSGLGLLAVLVSGVAHGSEAIPSGLTKAVSILERTESGKKLLSDARKKGLSIQEGKISKTEIVATRQWVGKREKLDFQIQVMISKDKSPVFQAIDLAHELVHALNPKTNPFDPKLSAVGYVREGIESRGGEAHAIMQECKVGQQLVGIVAEEQAQLIKARCQFVWNSEKNQDQWLKSFYHLGRYLHAFRNQLDAVSGEVEENERISELSVARDPMFTSAAANKPYPLALLEEYVEITRKICSRSEKRKSETLAGNPMEERCQSLSSAVFSTP